MAIHRNDTQPWFRMARCLCQMRDKRMLVRAGLASNTICRSPSGWGFFSLCESKASSEFATIRKCSETCANQIGSIKLDRPSLFGFHVCKSAVGPTAKTPSEVKAHRFASDTAPSHIALGWKPFFHTNHVMLRRLSW